MTTSRSAMTPFIEQDWRDLEAHVDDRLSATSGLLGVAIVEVDRSLREAAVERLSDHLDAEDHTARVDDRFVIVRDPLTGPAEMEGLGLRIADSFPAADTADDDPIERATVHIGVVTGRRGDAAHTLLRHAGFSLDDAKMIGRPIIPVDDGPRILDRAT